MKIGLVGYQGSGKSTLFELLTGTQPDLAKVQSGQVGITIVPDERFDKLVEMYNPKKVVPAKIELFDTPGLSRDQQSLNPQRLGVIRESTALVHVVGCYAGVDPIAEVQAFEDDMILADAQIMSNRVERLRKDSTKPRPDRDELQAELAALEPLFEKLNDGQSLVDEELSELQEKVTRSFSLLTRKSRLTVLNTAESDYDEDVIKKLETDGNVIVAAPIGLELEVQALPEEEREEFAAEMGLKSLCRVDLLKSIFQVTEQITFFTCDEKEVHAWLLKRGSTAVEAADSIHSDLARGFIRADVMSVEDLIRLGSEREVKAAGLHHVEGKEYIVNDGDEIVIRSGV